MDTGSRATEAAFETVGRGLVEEVEAAAAGAEYLKELTVFDADLDAMPTISLSVYLLRWMSYSGCSIGSVVAAGLYLKRSSIRVTARNKHRMLLAALIVSAKYHDDAFYANSYYASVGGSTPAEVNRVETAFLDACSWKLFVRPEEYAAKVARYTEMARASPPSPTLAMMEDSCSSLGYSSTDSDAQENHEAWNAVMGSSLVDVGLSLYHTSVSLLFDCTRPALASSKASAIPY